MATDTLTFDNLRRVLEDYAKSAADTYSDKIRKGRPPYGSKSASGRLEQVGFQVSDGDMRFEVQLELQDYWKYVESGRKPGKFPPVSAILQWIKVKPVIPRPDDRGRIPTQQQLAFLIARSIARNGIEPFPALAQTSEQTYASFEQQLAEAFAADIGNNIEMVTTLFRGL